MIRSLELADLDEVMQIWLDSNLQEHDFIALEHWRQNYDFTSTAY